MEKKIKENKWVFSLTLIFAVLIGWIILFKMQFSLDVLDRIRGVNLIPFYYKNEVSFHFREVLYNLIVFIPLGIYLKLMKLDSKKSILLGFSFSLVLELLQFIIKVGITDITDLLTNTTGVAIGVIIYIILSKVFKKTEKLDFILKILATIGTILFGLLMLILIISN